MCTSANFPILQQRMICEASSQKISELAKKPQNRKRQISQRSLTDFATQLDNFETSYHQRSIDFCESTLPVACETRFSSLPNLLLVVCHGVSNKARNSNILFLFVVAVLWFKISAALRNLSSCVAKSVVFGFAAFSRVFWDFL